MENRHIWKFSSTGTTAESILDYSSIKGYGRPIELVLAFLRLIKIRLTILAVATTAGAFLLASGSEINWTLLIWTAIGTMLASSGASAFNQVLEHKADSRMGRTRNRPLPTGIISPLAAFLTAFILLHSGILVLHLKTSHLVLFWTSFAALIYVFVYTPLKYKTELSTFAGAVSGAVLPLIGWVAATGKLESSAWILAALLFVWQIPHFLSLASIYRDDLRMAGFRMLPLSDLSGRKTCLTILVFSYLIIPASIGAFLTGIGGNLFLAGSMILNTAFILLAHAFYRNRTATMAGNIFLASIFHLPLLLGLMILESPLI